ncbi:hypothetical protein [Nocardia wallacei]|uniref:hypothetical protein n=1 Tax=Nocardia wallacei TaxID=480035 RepID=UPI0024542966|nr:hypothetical protein [Nocardia wallacei]
MIGTVAFSISARIQMQYIAEVEIDISVVETSEFAGFGNRKSFTFAVILVGE